MSTHTNTHPAYVLSCVYMYAYHLSALLITIAMLMMVMMMRTTMLMIVMLHCLQIEI